MFVIIQVEAHARGLKFTFEAVGKGEEDRMRDLVQAVGRKVSDLKLGEKEFERGLTEFENDA